MVIIPKRNWRVCLHCGKIFRKEEAKQSVSMKSGTFEICPKCSCPTKKEYSGNLLTKVTASYYFNIVENIDNGVYKTKEEAINQYKNKMIPQKLWYFGSKLNPITKRKVEDEDDLGSLVCKICGYKISDEGTVREMRKKFKGMDTHDIPYYCGACQDMVSDDEYYEMMREMKCEIE